MPALVEAVAELVQRGEVRDAEVVQVVARRDPDVLRAERLRERVRRRVQAPAVGVEADRLEHGHHGAALVVDLERPGEGAVVARALAVPGRTRHELHELVAQRREQRPQLRGRQPGLEVVEQDVVGVRGGLEALDVAVAQLDVARQRVAETREVRGRAGLLPRLLAERVGVADLRRQRGGHAHRLLVVAADGGEHPHVVGVGVLVGRPRVEAVEQPADLGVGDAAVADQLERRGVVRAAGRPVGRHHRVLVPEQQRVDAAEIAQLRHPRLQRGQLGWGCAHEPASS